MVNGALNGAGVPSMQAKFDEMFAPKVEVKEEVTGKRVRSKKVKSEKEKVRRKSKKAAAKKEPKGKNDGFLG